MNDNENDLYEPRVRPHEREDSESDNLEWPAGVVLRISPGRGNGPETIGVQITLPTIHEIPLVPGPDLVQ